ncbi:hypothetical protein S40288_06816 [Stachybotrys chartarum IBT 40288]|nr:hypothetical protein S40288_06816 [Stachybotrys chartarum IBT 40288]
MCAIAARDQEAEDSSRSKVRSIQGFVAACLVLSVVLAFLRFYVRLSILRSFRKDDWAVVATLILMICSGAMATVASHHGLGSHMSILTDSEKTFFLVLIWISSLGYLSTIIALKTAFLLQYRRAFPLPTFQRLCDIFLGFLAVWLLAGFITQFAICHPLSQQWDPMVIENGHSCKARFHFWLANAIVHVATDIVLFIMPFPMIRNLPQNRMQKFVLGGVFSLGFFTCAISAIRLTTLHAALMGTDQSWEMATTLFWSVGEATCAVVCLCVPTLRPLLAPKKQWRSGQIWTGEPEQRPFPERVTRPESDAWNYHAALREAETLPSTSADGS